MNPTHNKDQYLRPCELNKLTMITSKNSRLKITQRIAIVLQSLLCVG